MPLAAQRSTNCGSSVGEVGDRVRCAPRGRSRAAARSRSRRSGGGWPRWRGRWRAGWPGAGTAWPSWRRLSSSNGVGSKRRLVSGVGSCTLMQRLRAAATRGAAARAPSPGARQPPAEVHQAARVGRDERVDAGPRSASSELGVGHRHRQVGVADARTCRRSRSSARRPTSGTDLQPLDRLQHGLRLGAEAQLAQHVAGVVPADRARPARPARGQAVARAPPEARSARRRDAATRRARSSSRRAAEQARPVQAHHGPARAAGHDRPGRRSPSSSARSVVRATRRAASAWPALNAGWPQQVARLGAASARRRRRRARGARRPPARGRRRRRGRSRTGRRGGGRWPPPRRGWLLVRWSSRRSVPLRYAPSLTKRPMISYLARFVRLMKNA